ncbi:MAG: serine hydrolase [Pseudomonadota bacterium]
MSLSLKHAAAGLAGFLLTLAIIFTDELRALAHLLDELASIEPDRIDETFRTLHLREDTVTVRNQGQAIPLPTQLAPSPFPETYVWMDQIRNSEALILGTQTTGIAVMHQGKLVFEKYDRGYGADTPATQMSVAKVYTSFLVGALLEDGKIQSLEDPIEDYLPELVDTAFEGVSIQNLLDMSSGVRWEEDLSNLDSEMVRAMIAEAIGEKDEFIRTLERIEEPGTYHRYASINMHPLNELVAAASGMSFQAYMEERLWTPMGAEFPANVADGGMTGGSLRDMLRFGQVYLDGGKNLLGQQIISREWTDISTVPDHPRLEPGADNPLSSSHHGYKHLWWIPIDYYRDFVALGVFGQFIYVNREYDVVIAKTSAYQNEFEDGGWKLQETVALFKQTAAAMGESID